jgi:hypothetical protein
MTTNNIELLTRSVTSRMEVAQRTLDKFVAELAVEPAHAMSWADKSVSAAGTVRVCAIILKALSEQESVSSLLKFGTEMVMRAGRYPARSSSPMNNLMEQSVAAAWAEECERMQHFC